ncbi:hypothetical protein [Rickettsia endosymbiont of Cantharis rufa]|uniref:hypothetical protein n=1 Tax=Rickettsia endosymbiont of Cantharis rufa TaxID=3066248 RepID=UPI003132DA85
MKRYKIALKQLSGKVLTGHYRNAIGMEDLDDNLKKIAINKTQERKNEIINLPKTSVSNSPKSQTKTQKFGNMVKEFVFPKALERHDKDNIVVQLALKDPILFIESLYTSRDDILNKKAIYFLEEDNIKKVFGRQDLHEIRAAPPFYRCGY